MTNSNLTLIAALLDRTGSMSSCKESTEGGFDELINSQKQEPGECQVTLAQFDRHGNGPVLTRVYSNLPIHQVPKLDLQPRGMTPLWDATGAFITEIGVSLAGLPEDNRPGTVICLIMTDGQENSSQEWSLSAVKKLIQQQQDMWNWKFLFLGANIDAVQVGMSMGMARGASITYDADKPQAVMDSYAVAGAQISNMRSGLQTEFSEEDRERAIGKKATSSPGGKKR